jgi:hypothetical protein
MQVQKDLIKVAGRMNLGGNTFNMFGMLGLVLQFLRILSHRLGLHPTALSLRLRRESVRLCAGLIGAWSSKVVN